VAIRARCCSSVSRSVSISRVTASCCAARIA
jgi:hypothetical protein